MEYTYQQFKIGYRVVDIKSELIDEIEIDVSSNEPTVEIIRGSNKFLISLSEVLVGFIDNVNEVQLDRKSNYVFIECIGSGNLHHTKATLSCKITKKTPSELKQEESARTYAEYQKKHEESTRMANEKRKAAREAKAALLSTDCFIPDIDVSTYLEDEYEKSALPKNK